MRKIMMIAAAMAVASFAYASDPAAGNLLELIP